MAEDPNHQRHRHISSSYLTNTKVLQTIPNRINPSNAEDLIHSQSSPLEETPILDLWQIEDDKMTPNVDIELEGLSAGAKLNAGIVMTIGPQHHLDSSPTPLQQIEVIANVTTVTSRSAPN